MKKPPRTPPEICPQCGTEVPRKALACPECGSDYETGWSEEARVQELGLPDENFDYDKFVKEEFGGGKDAPAPRSKPLWWWVAAIILLAAVLLWFISE